MLRLTTWTTRSRCWARATLLLRLATGSVSQLLKESGSDFERELDFWWNSGSGAPPTLGARKEGLGRSRISGVTSNQRGGCCRLAGGHPETETSHWGFWTERGRSGWMLSTVERAFLWDWLDQVHGFQASPSRNGLGDVIREESREGRRIVDLFCGQCGRVHGSRRWNWAKGCSLATCRSSRCSRWSGTEAHPTRRPRPAGTWVAQGRGRGPPGLRGVGRRREI